MDFNKFEHILGMDGVCKKCVLLVGGYLKTPNLEIPFCVGDYMSITGF